MKKRLISLLTAGLLAFSALAGCGGGDGKDSGSGAGSTQAGAESGGIDTSETYEATMVMIGSPQGDQDAVLAAINEILLRDINTKLNIVMLSVGDFSTQLPLMLQGGDKVDIVPVLSSFAGSFISNRLVIDLSDYVEQYGTNMKKVFSEIDSDLLYTGCVNDFMYGIPVYNAGATVSTICLRKDWLEEAGFTREDIESVEDLEPIYEKVQSQHPEAVMLWLNKGYADSRLETADPLTDYNGVLLNGGEKPEVVNYFASEEYKNLVTRHYRWAQKGWISKDASTTTDQPASAVQAGRAFSFYTPGGPDAELGNSVSAGTEMICVPVTEEMVTTTGYCWNSWGIAGSSSNPERAFLLLDYLYNSPKVSDLISYGIADVHYVVGDDGLYDYPEGVDASNAAYSLVSMRWQLPNMYAGGYWAGDDPELLPKKIEIMNGAKKSCALGFAYDSSALSMEIAAITNVRSQYVDALNTGALNPDEELPKFLEELDNAGINTVIEEKQKQLDAWLAAREG